MEEKKLLCILKNIKIVLMVLFSIIILDNHNGYAEIQDKTDYTNIDNIIARYNDLKNNQTNKIENDQNLYVFISFSMPDKMIKNYFIESQILKEKYNINIIFVLMGFYKNSFKATSEKIALLLKDLDKKDVPITIDPITFKKYNIEKVPTFLKKFNTENYDIMSGAVNIDYFIEKIKEEHDK